MFLNVQAMIFASMHLGRVQMQHLGAEIYFCRLVCKSEILLLFQSFRKFEKMSTVLHNIYINGKVNVEVGGWIILLALDWLWVPIFY